MALGAVLGSGVPAFAQATRTWVSGVGDDVNPCSRTAPCKTFAGAISKTATGGEINALDPAGYGAVTVTKSITIDGGGEHASILASLVTGVIVNITTAGNDRVILRNLSINGAGNGVNGVRVIAGEAVHVENCTIFGFTGSAIRVENNAELFVSNTTIRDNDLAGVNIIPGATPLPPPRVLLDRVIMEDNGTGFLAQTNALATVRGSSAAGNNGAGFSATGAGVELNLHDSAAANNDTGILADQSARVRFLGVSVAGNTTAGLLAQNAAEIVPFTDNQIVGNPAGTAAMCQLDTASSAIPCPDVAPTCPATCPAPVCEAPIIGPGIGPCKKCKTKKGVTTCSSCTIAVQ
jgi:hypothetical protein